MEITEQGKVQGGGIILSKPLALPDGTEVVVRIEPRIAEPAAEASKDDEDLASLPFFGMWEDRADMSDASSWVRAERERWQRAHPEP